MYTIQIPGDSVEQQMALFGPHDEHAKIIEKALSVTVNARNSMIEISGEDENAVNDAGRVLDSLKQVYKKDELINADMVHRMVELVESGNVRDGLEAMDDVVVLTPTGKPIKCKTIGQKNLVKALQDTSVTVCIGPAGTGKTFLAVAQAVAEFKRGEIERIIMSRPAIEAGEERLGFLPGDLAQKVDPYLRPLYDALNDILGAETARKFQEKGIIEIAPLAYMRGRTLSNARIIIDESQNASLQTLKMALTRLGEGSKMVLTGDVTQIDLPKTTSSGLQKVASILKSVDGVSIVRLNNQDVVRNKIVRDIIKAFEKEETRQLEKDAQAAKRGRGNYAPRIQK